MILPWLIFITVGLITYAGFLKLAARLLRYKVSWMASFLFALIVFLLVIFDHVLAFDQPVAIRIVHVAVLLLVLVILGSWFFSARGMNRSGDLLGWGGGIRLVGITFAMMVIVAFAIALPVHSFSVHIFRRRSNAWMKSVALRWKFGVLPRQPCTGLSPCR